MNAHDDVKHSGYSSSYRQLAPTPLHHHRQLQSHIRIAALTISGIIWKELHFIIIIRISVIIIIGNGQEHRNRNRNHNHNHIHHLNYSVMEIIPILSSTKRMNYFPSWTLCRKNMIMSYSTVNET